MSNPDVTKEKHPIRNAVIAGLIVAAITQLFPVGRESVVAVAGFLFSWLRFIFIDRHLVRGWALVLLFSLALPSAFHLLRKLIPKAAPSFQSKYTEDLLFGARWRWVYTPSGIARLSCYCPACDMALVYSEYGEFGTPASFTYPAQSTKLKCERCKTTVTAEQGDFQYLQDKVQREIERKIRTGEWGVG